MGRVLSALERCGLSGDMLVDHATLVKGAMLHDPCVRVPLIARWPGFLDGGRRCKAVVQLHDLAATIAAAAVDLCGIGSADDGFGACRPYAVCAYRNSGIDDTGRYWDPPIDATMVRRGRYKLHAYHPVKAASARRSTGSSTSRTIPGRRGTSTPTAGIAGSVTSSRIA